jgi:hypothetical protein
MGNDYNFYHDNHHLGSCTGTSSCPYLYDDNHRRYYHDSASHDYVVNDNDNDDGAPDDHRSVDIDYLKHKHKYNVDLASPYDDQFHHDRTHNYTVHDAPSNNHLFDNLFDNFYDEFNKHYNHDNDDDRTATAIDYVNNHDYDSPPDDDFYDDFYFDHFHDGACDEHLVNKHHNYD